MTSEAQRAYQRDWFQRNKDDRMRHQRQRRAALKAWVAELKSVPCVDCNDVFHHAAMQWDHRPGVDKVMNVSRMIALKPNREAILAEIAKCDLVCANCHAIRTFDRAERCD